MDNLQDLLIAELKDIYSAEKQIVKALPKMVRGAKTPELKSALTEHLEVTKVQVTRLEEVFAAAGQKAKAKHCKGMEGLLSEGAEILSEESAGSYRDLQLIGAAQRVEHYEVAAYGTARAIAERCGMQECVALLAQTLEEEEAADETLTQIASGIYDSVAPNGADDSEEEQEMMAVAGAGNGTATSKKAAAKRSK